MSSPDTYPAKTIVADRTTTVCNGAVTVERRSIGGYSAFKTGDRRIFAIGQSQYEAVGDLVMHHPEQFFDTAAPVLLEALKQSHLALSNALETGAIKCRCWGACGCDAHEWLEDIGAAIAAAAPSETGGAAE